MVRSRSKTDDTFANLLRELLGRMNWTQTMLAERLGMSSKTLTRYLYLYAFPPASRRHGIVAALHDIDPPLLARIAASLGIASHLLPAQAPAVAGRADGPVEQRAVHAAALGVAEALDVGPVRVRAALAKFVADLARANVDLKTAHAALVAMGGVKKN